MPQKLRKTVYFPTKIQFIEQFWLKCYDLRGKSIIRSFKLVETICASTARAIDTITTVTVRDW